MKPRDVGSVIVRIRILVTSVERHGVAKWGSGGAVRIGGLGSWVVVTGMARWYSALHEATVRLGRLRNAVGTINVVTSGVQVKAATAHVCGHHLEDNGKLIGGAQGWIIRALFTTKRE